MRDEVLHLDMEVAVFAQEFVDDTIEGDEVRGHVGDVAGESDLLLGELGNRVVINVGSLTFEVEND